MKKSYDLGQHIGWSEFSQDGLTLRRWGAVFTGCSKNCARCRAFGARRESHESNVENFFAAQAKCVDYSGNTWAFERVRRHKGVDAAHVYGGIKASLIRHAYRSGIEARPIEVSTWKKKIGVRGQSKEAYIARVNELTGLSFSLDDEDICAAIGVGIAAFCPDLTKLQVVRP
jgi:hypothetical protein